MMDMFTIGKAWVMARLKERTSWDGAVLIAAGVAYIVLGPLATVAAYGAIAYGAWTIWKKEKGE
jgi:hypothetical protein